ncbi:hypothetical protein [Reinekea thalattae]|uniref:Uncharacterized protein n=1 Tax=Reinekea thalattae TaxID=2593301 RepID=A0A5C8Z7P2_9GAMM|nr:hypothetical protein [Reinekea thalattae]TXR54105.1 hypothetical protein FME95_06085 [Reinekea thalattae]
MGELAIILKMIVLVISIIAVISHFASVKQVKDETKRVANSLTESDSLEVEAATEQELAVLSEAYKLTIIEPVQITAISGDIETHTLTINSSNSTVVSVGGVQVQMPKLLKGETIENLLEKIVRLSNANDSTRIALVGKKFYLLSRGNFKLVEGSHKRELDSIEVLESTAEATSKLGSGTAVAAEELGIKFISERESTEAETLAFAEKTVGKRYAISMMIIFVIVALFFASTTAVYVWSGICFSVLAVGLLLWSIATARKPSSFNIKKMSATFKQVINADDNYVEIENHDSDALNIKLSPQWNDHLDSIPIGKKVHFEVKSKNSEIIAIDNISPAKTDNSTQKTNAYHHWRLASVAFLLLVLLVNTHFSDALLSVRMLINPGVLQINTPDDWNTIESAGQRVDVLSVNKQCLALTEDSDFAMNAYYSCEQFDVLSNAQKNDLSSITEPMLKNLTAEIEPLYFEQMSEHDYYQLELQYALAVSLGQSYQFIGQTLRPRRELYIYNMKQLHQWAQWLNNNWTDSDYDSDFIKTEIVRLWEEAEPGYDCARSNDCFSHILNFDFSEISESSATAENVILDSAVVDFYDLKSTYIVNELQALVDQWQAEGFSKIAAGDLGTSVQLVNNVRSNDGWFDFANFLNGTSDGSVDFYADSAKEVSASLSDFVYGAINGLTDIVEQPIGYGVVSRIEESQEGRLVYLNVAMTDERYIDSLAMIVSIMLAVFIIILMLAVSRLKNEKAQVSYSFGN